MARSFVVSPIFRLALAASLPSVAFFNCQKPKSAPHNFDAPDAIVMLPSGDPLHPHLYGFATDPGHFAIRRIDAESRKLVEPRFPVGRRLSALAGHTGANGVADVLFGIDKVNHALVRIDAATALTPTVAPPTSSPACCTLGGLHGTSGLTGTETWTVTYRASIDRWEVVGSGSGVQQKMARTNAGYQTDQQQVSFDIRASVAPAEGDAFTFSTDNGITVPAVLGSALALNMVTFDATRALVTTQDPPSIAVLDLAASTITQSFALPAGAIPAGIDVAGDLSAAFVSDLGNAVVYQLNTTGPVSGWTLATFPAPVSMRDLAVTGDGARLFAMAAEADDIFIFTLPDMLPVDFNGRTPGFDPLAFPSALRALGAARLTHGTHGTGTPIFPVLVMTHAGSALVAQGGTGCLDFADAAGARFAGASFRDSALPSNPKFRVDLFSASRCGGTARTETWSIVYDGIAKIWRATGSVSGPQTGGETEGSPYTTDRGEITFQIDGDAGLPSDDGDKFFLSVLDDLAPIGVGFVPGKPVFFRLPPNANGEVFERALVPNAASDTIADVDLDNRRVVVVYH